MIMMIVMPKVLFVNSPNTSLDIFGQASEPFFDKYEEVGIDKPQAPFTLYRFHTKTVRKCCRMKTA